MPRKYFQSLGPTEPIFIWIAGHSSCQQNLSTGWLPWALPWKTILLFGRMFCLLLCIPLDSCCALLQIVWFWSLFVDQLVKPISQTDSIISRKEAIKSDWEDVVIRVHWFSPSIAVNYLLCAPAVCFGISCLLSVKLLMFGLACAVSFWACCHMRQTRKASNSCCGIFPIGQHKRPALNIVACLSSTCKWFSFRLNVVECFCFHRILWQQFTDMSPLSVDRWIRTCCQYNITPM